MQSPESVNEYFRRVLNSNPHDVSLNDLDTKSPCGQDCVKVIDAAATMLGVADSSLHDEIQRTTRKAVSILWHG